jgi:L-ascorbate metabolism protein UlaG (beta-lactamase superfamily)
MAPLSGVLLNDTARRSRWSMLYGTHQAVDPSHRPEPGTWKQTGITACWIGQATVLINFDGTWIITDPVFSERAGINLLGLVTLGPKRLVAPALTMDELPGIDLILLSHAHMDHMDIPSLRRFKRDTQIVMAKNTADVIDSLGFQKVNELDWGETIHRSGVRIEAVRVRHFGWRYPWENDRSKSGTSEGRSFNAYLLTKNNKSILFAGDTAYQEYFKALASRGLSIDLAIMPIGAYDPWISNHCSPEQAVLMANQAGARAIMPVHWGTFIQSSEPAREPIERFKTALAATPGRIALADIGETWRWEG